MASSHDTVSMAVFCDFENVALGVRDANYDKFDIKPVLERLLLKGSIVVKKAYCDWERYKGFKAAMHEANFELIEIPHVRQSGKNSADIRMVVDALDLCYTKSHVNTFVIISGDSDFSPLVSKLRENAKQVIAVGVKQSTSDLLVTNCDEFIFYDDLVREKKRTEAKRDERKAQPAAKRSPDEGNRRKEELDTRKSQAIEMAVETFDALVSERGDSGKIWASMLKEAIKRRKPDFSESYYGFRTFGNLLEEAQARGLLEFGRDEKSGAFVYRSSAPAPVLVDGSAEAGSAPVEAAERIETTERTERSARPDASERPERGPRPQRNERNGRGGRNGRVAAETVEPVAAEQALEVNGNQLHDVDAEAERLDKEANGNRLDVEPTGKRQSGKRGGGKQQPQNDGRRNGRGGARNAGASLYRGAGAPSSSEQAIAEVLAEQAAHARAELAKAEAAAEESHEVKAKDKAAPEPRGRASSRRKVDYRASPAVSGDAEMVAAPVVEVAPVAEVAPVVAALEVVAVADEAPVAAEPRRNARAPRKPAAKKAAAVAEAAAPVEAPVVADAPVAEVAETKKPAARSRRPRKADTAAE